MNPETFGESESLLITVALNKHVECFLNKNVSKHSRK